MVAQAMPLISGRRNKPRRQPSPNSAPSEARRNRSGPYCAQGRGRPVPMRGWVAPSAGPAARRLRKAAAPPLSGEGPDGAIRDRLPRGRSRTGWNRRSAAGSEGAAGPRSAAAPKKPSASGPAARRKGCLGRWRRQDVAEDDADEEPDRQDRRPDRAPAP